MERADAVVVGGGAAGLAAAAEFTRAGKRVVVLEARDRLGGRIDTLFDARAPVPVELGAEFIHGRPPEIDEIVRAASLATYAPDGEHWRLQDGRLTLVPDYWSRVGTLLTALEPGVADRPAAAFLDERARSGEADASVLARDYLEAFHAADVQRLGTAALAAAEGAPPRAAEAQGVGRPGVPPLAAGAETRRVLGGFTRLVDELAARAGGDLRPRTPVDAILWSAAGVVVRAGATAIASRVAVVTVPLGVLLLRPGETGAIRFEPEPADHLDAARSLAMGQVTKAVVLFREPFWEWHGTRLPALSFLHLPGQPFPTWWSLHPISSGMLTGWAGGPAGTALAGRDPDDLKEAALTSLAAAFGESVSALRARTVSCWTKDWSQDPFARGAYAYVPVGAAWAPRRLAEPAGGTLFFAGEAVSGDLWLGTVDAAIASGRRAARAALAAAAE